MPTNLIHSLSTFFQEDTIIASDVGLVSRRALTIDPDGIAPNAEGNRIIRAGTIAYKIAGQTMGRVGVRSLLGEAITASSTTTFELVDQGVQFQTPSAAYFKAGDVLVAARPFGTITLALTWAEDDTLLITVGGYSLTYTATGSATLATLATEAAAAWNADPVAAGIAQAIAAGAVIHFFSTDQTRHALATTATTAGDGTATASAAALAPGAAIGTVDLVNYADGEITLEAAAGVTLPAGAPIGIAGATPWGLVVNAYNAGKGDNDVACFTGGSIYQDRLYYWDREISEAFKPGFTTV